MNPEQLKSAPRPVPGVSSPAREYSREVHSSWAEFLGTLPNDARILDLDTGNHVVALIAADLAISRGYGWTIEAIAPPQGQEQAATAREGQALIERINFSSDGTPSHLPFDDASFDAVGGHHVLEFTDSAVMLAETFRVLKPGGDAQFVMHHAESVLVHAAKVSLSEADLVFTQMKAFRRLRQLVTMSHIVPGATERASDEVRAAIRTLKAALPGAQRQGGGRVLSVALDSIQNLLAARRELKPDAAGLAVERAEADLRGSVRRLGDLVARASGEAEMQQVQQHAATAGFDQIERMPQIHADGQVMAWQLLMHRP